MNFEEKESGIEDELKKLGYWNNLYSKNDYLEQALLYLRFMPRKFLINIL